MMTEIAKAVYARTQLVALFSLLCALSMIWVFSLETNIGISWWIALLVLSICVLVMSFGIYRKWDFRKISMKLRSGVMIKYTFWGMGIMTIVSAIPSYLLFVEQQNYTWPVLIYFVLSLASLIIMMSLRYSIEEDSKKRGVCEFC
jgi:hypothetical protein